MNNVYCDKPGHGIYPLLACEKDGKIYVDMDSCPECGSRNDKEKDFLDRLSDLVSRLNNLKWDLDGLKDDVEELIEDYEE